MSDASFPETPENDIAPVDPVAFAARLKRRKFADRVFVWLGLAATAIGLAVLALLVMRLWVDGHSRLSLDFFTHFASRDAKQAGILAAWVGSLLVIVTTACVAIPIGVLAGLYLEEYARKSWVTDVIEVTVNNLAGVPSIVYGLLALGLFVYTFQLGQTVLTAGLTLALLILPIIIVATREAIRGVPQAIRDAAMALGATKWQCTAHHVLPYSMPGIITGGIIGLSRALGETAPLITIGALTYIAFLPVKMPGDPRFIEVGHYNSFGTLEDPSAIERVRVPAGGVMKTLDGQSVPIEIGGAIDAPAGATIETHATWVDAVSSWAPWNWLHEAYTVLPIQMFNWTSRPQDDFRINAAAAGLVLLFITLLMNGAAIWLRYKLRQNIKW
jgi:phosphate transport system permease protein